MAEPPHPSSSVQASFHTGANTNPTSSTYLRQRPLGRSATISESISPTYRRNSTLSDSVSEARQSIRDSTDDLLFPRVKTPGANPVLHHEESHWHSAPLAVALLPAVGGLFFKNGSAVITDATLLILAAIFLNWSVRLPWDWYRSAQEVSQPASEEIMTDEIEEEEEGDGGHESSPEAPDKSSRKEEPHRASIARGATHELHIHEITALVSCFVFPLIGSWVLHAIRGSLSRPSEGLVSNYNLTIFVLAAEIRPFAHLLRMVQARTLYLQRVVEASSAGHDKIDSDRVADMAKRLEELEAHVADTAAAQLSSNSGDTAPKGAGVPQEALLQVTSDVRRGIQPELDALNRAVRRYEKRTTLMAFQTDSRLRELETQVRDAVALAAAAQRSATERRPSFAFILLDWICAIVVIPFWTFSALANLPARIAAWCYYNLKVRLGGKQKRRVNKGKQPQIRTVSDRRRTPTPAAVPTAWGGKGPKNVL